MRYLRAILNLALHGVVVYSGPAGSRDIIVGAPMRRSPPPVERSAALPRGEALLSPIFGPQGPVVEDIKNALLPKHFEHALWAILEKSPEWITSSVHSGAIPAGSNGPTEVTILLNDDQTLDQTEVVVTREQLSDPSKSPYLQPDDVNPWWATGFAVVAEQAGYDPSSSANEAMVLDNNAVSPFSVLTGHKGVITTIHAEMGAEASIDKDAVWELLKKGNHSPMVFTHFQNDQYSYFTTVANDLIVLSTSDDSSKKVTFVGSHWVEAVPGEGLTKTLDQLFDNLAQVFYLTDYADLSTGRNA